MPDAWGKPHPVSVVLRFPEPTADERARANAYFGALAEANRRCANRAELQEEYNRIWREFNEPKSPPVNAWPKAQPPKGTW